jgi:hypothetical protein
MLKILNARRDPDLSIPQSVIGLTTEEVIVPPPNLQLVRYEEHQHLMKLREENIRQRHRNLDLKQKLTLCYVSNELEISFISKSTSITPFTLFSGMR